MKRFFIALLLLVPLTSIANVFGEDTRKRWDQWPDIPHPLDRIGTLKHPSGNRCSASYIGKNLLLTAAHCIMKDGQDRLQKGDYLFEHIQLPNGKYWDSRKITKFHYIELKQIENGGLGAAENHWAILEMTSAIQPKTRTFGMKYPGDKDYDIYHESNYQLSIAGFSPMFNDGTRELTFSESGCEIIQHLRKGNLALHTCGAGPRDSGAPLYKCTEGGYGNWSQCYIIGIHIAAYSENGLKFPKYAMENANLAVTMRSFKDIWYYLMMGGNKPDNLISIDNNYLEKKLQRLESASKQTNTKEPTQFHFYYQNKKSERRDWIKKQDRWEEGYPSGSKAQFIILGRTDAPGMPGQLLRREPDNGQRLFIPDKGNKHMRLGLKNSGSDWFFFANMLNVR